MTGTDSIKASIGAFELRSIGWMEHHGLIALRVALGVVFIWFGILKPFDMSPASQLVADVTWWIPIPNFNAVLGIWEIAIGVCFLFKPLLRVALLLLFLHMPGTALPFFLAPERCWEVFPFALTLEGQYIVKNLVLVSAALVIGGTIRLRASGFARFAPDEFQSLLHNGSWGTAEAGQVLTEEGRPNDRVYFIHSGKAEVIRGGEQVADLEPHQFVGEMSYLTGEPACATVRATEKLSFIHWSREELERLIDEQPSLREALHTTLNLDLISKLRAGDDRKD